MNKKRASLFICALGLAAAAAFQGGVSTSNTLGQRAQVAHPPAVSQTEMPEHKAYEFLFRRVAFFRKKTAEVGKPAALDKRLQREMHLDDAQMRALDQIAATCLQEVEAQDAEARIVINAFKERYFIGKVVPRGQPLPPPPPELEAMQQRRNAMLMRGRGLLLAALGEGTFNQFNSFVKERFGGKIPDSYYDRPQRPNASGP